MGSIVAAMLSSHAYAFLEPDRWDERRLEHSLPLFARRQGTVAIERPEVAGETLVENERRFTPIRDGFAALRRGLEELRPDALVMLGNDQDELFGATCLPQFAIYTGGGFTATDRQTKQQTVYRSVPRLAAAILDAAVDAEFDCNIVEHFPEGELSSHAHREALLFFDPHARQSVVPIFVNTIHEPSPSPKRCYAFGQLLRSAIERDPEAGRVVLFSSGGLSHFAPDFPFARYRGPHGLGAICEDFDRRLVTDMLRGDGAALQRLSSQDLFENGDLELRQTIVMLGALGAARPTFLRYEPFYRAIMGLAVGLWELTAS